MNFADSKHRTFLIPLFMGVALAAVIAFVFRASDSVPTGSYPAPFDQREFSETSSSSIRLAPNRPMAKPTGDYIGSTGCSGCHAGEHRTWHASYHRTMTQVASTADRLFGDFNDVTVTNHAIGRSYRLANRDSQLLFFTGNHPQIPPSGAEEHAFQVVMTTGSHHMQAYWFATPQNQSLGLVPFVYLREDKRWVPRNAVFLTQPFDSDSFEFGRWNDTCIGCHTTPERYTKESANGFESRATEFGISCEACHGPGKRHVDYQQAIGNRSGTSPAIATGNDPIVNPKSISASKSSQICGSCHSISFSLKPGNSVIHSRFLPGEELSNHVHVARGTVDSARHQRAVLSSLSPEDIAADTQNRFWPDGHVRVSGREYNGLLETPCHQRGKLSCISCHTLHPSKQNQQALVEWADDQLRSGMRKDAACTQCHEAGKYADIKHTHHQSDSTGSECLNCHMPHTTYGLLKAIRSHTIDSPNALTSTQTGRPNACNLCHLDRSLSWTAEHLTDWFGQPRHQVGGDWNNVSAAVLWSLTGDAAQRALIAWHFNWEPARAISGTNWFAPYLAILAGDDYDAVRFMTTRSLRRLPEYAGLNFDFVGPAPDRKHVIEAIMKRWSQSKINRKKLPASVLIDSGGEIRDLEIKRLLEKRDLRPVGLLE